MNAFMCCVYVFVSIKPNHVRQRNLFFDDEVRAVGAHGVGHAKVADLDHIAVTQQHIARCQVHVHEAQGRDVGTPTCQLVHKIQLFAHVQFDVVLLARVEDRTEISVAEKFQYRQPRELLHRNTDEADDLDKCTRCNPSACGIVTQLRMEL